VKRTASQAIAAAVLGAWIVVLLACGGIRREDKEAGKSENSARPPATVSRNEQGLAVVSLNTDTQRRIGLKTAPLRSMKLETEVAAYGRLMEDPAEVFVLRAPVAGTLRRSPGMDWPAIGKVIEKGSTVGVLAPRLNPVERITLADRLTAARAEVTAATAARTAARSAYERAKILNADNKNLSDRALQEAEARWKAEEARATAARETVRLLASSLRSPGLSTTSVGLVVEGGGEVVEVLAQPGESVEAGQPVVRLARFDSLIARVSIPAGQTISLPVRTARIAALGHEDAPLPGRRISLAARVDPDAQGQAFLFRLSNPGGLRPGLAVIAYLRVPGEPRRGFLAPPSALVRAAGQAWIYVQQDAERFVRRAVTTEYRPGGAVFVTGAVDGDGRIVTVGAQTLFSEESKAQIQVGEEGEGD